jgi:hypothetical protein
MAYDNLVLEPLSVVQKLRQVGLYADFAPGSLTPTNGVKTIQEETLNIVLPNGQSFGHSMGIVDYYDIKIFADELDLKLKLMNPFIQYLFAKNAVELVRAMRGVAYTTGKAGFKGSSGSGNQLDAMLFRAEQFADPDIVANTARTSWARVINGVNVGTSQFIVATDGGALAAKGPLVANSTPATAEAICILGFANPAARPCTSAFQPTYLTQAYNVQNCDFELIDDEYGYPAIELAQPLFIWPGESAAISVRYYKQGTDELRPIGLWFKISTNMRALATS